MVSSIRQKLSTGIRAVALAAAAVIAQPTLGGDLSLPLSDEPLGYWDIPVTISGSGSELAEIRRRGQDAAEIHFDMASDPDFALATGFSTGLADPLRTTSLKRADGLWSVNFKTPRTSSLPSFDLQYAVGRFDWDTSHGFDDKQNQRFSVKSKGRVAGISYGFSHASIGEDYAEFGKGTKIKDKGKAVSKIWLGHSFGKFSLQPFVKRSRNNIEAAADRPVITDEVAGLSLDYTWSSWPYFGTSVSYASGTRASSKEPSGFSPFQTGIGTLAAGATLSLDTWSLYASADQTTPNASQPQSHNQPETTSYYIGASFYPSSRLSFTPSVYLTDEVYDAMESITRTIGSNLSMSLQPKGRDYELMAYASYDNSKNADWALDSSYLYSELGVRWNMDRRNDARQTLALTVAYDDYQDGFYPDTNTSDVSIRLTFRSVGLPGIFAPPRNQWDAQDETLWMSRF
jgi:hypothetical protein